jgi:hypothetical protein
MKILKTFKNEEKSAVISISKEILSCTFYENGKHVGEIEYPNNSYTYVEDAAENWIIGVMTHETIREYKKVA